jgi:hypothetical protein
MEMLPIAGFAPGTREGVGFNKYAEGNSIKRYEMI